MIRIDTRTSLLSLGIVALATPSVRAGGGCDGTLFAGNAVGSANPGAVSTLDPVTFAGVIVGNPLASGGLSGLTFTLDDRLWGAVRYGGGFGTGSDLVEIDPTTGAQISLTAITSGGAAIRISDLATQPGTGTVFGIGNSTVTGTPGDLFTISTATAVATLVGNAGLGIDGGLGFAPDGTLYLISASVAVPTLATLDPATAAPITVMSYGPDVGCDGLAVRPSDGAVLATRGSFAGGDLIVGVNSTTGATTPLGSTTTGTPSDIAFRPCGTGTAVCFGDGTGTACPCFNPGGTGAGCANGTGAGGVLTAAGTASVSNDSLTLTADGVINNNGLFFQGNNTIGGGAGIVFGDGIRCCGGNVVRIQVVNPPGTTSPATAQMTETATTNGPNGTVTAGTKKCYQYWYRDPVTSPCGSQFNLTNAVSVTWQP